MFVFVHSAAVRYLGTTGENYSGQLELLKHTKNVVTFKRRLGLLSKLYHLASALFFFPVLTYARWDRQVLHLTVFKNLNDARGL